MGFYNPFCTLFTQDTTATLHFPGANVLLDDDGKVKLADFGAAIKLTNKEFQQDRRPCGTEAFMAPEVKHISLSRKVGIIVLTAFAAFASVSLTLAKNKTKLPYTLSTMLCIT